MGNICPAKRREALERGQAALGVSERRACRAIAQPRSRQRYKPLEVEAENPLTERIIALATKYGRNG